MSLSSKKSKAHVERLLAEVRAGQETAGAEMSSQGVSLLTRQLRGEITVDEAVAQIAARAQARLGQPA